MQLQRDVAVSCRRHAPPTPGSLAGSSQPLRPAVHAPHSALLQARGGKPVRRVVQPARARQRRSPVVTPDITIVDGEDESYMDLMQYLLRQRIVFLSGYVNDKVATQIVGSLLALEALDEDEPIRLYINSSGGQPYSIIGVVDTILAIKPPVQTLALGACYSYASLILAAGTKGQRFAMKNTRIMMTQPMGGSKGDFYQVDRTVKELNAIYQLFARYYMKFTGMDQDKVEKNTCRDYFMTPEDAVDEGLIDGIIRGKDDYTPPPSSVRKLRDFGLIDRLTGGVLKIGD